MALAMNGDDETANQDIDAPGLVDEVEGSFLEGGTLVLDERMAGEKHDRGLAPGLAQLGQKLDAGDVRHGPVEHHDIWLVRDLERLQESFASGKGLYAEPPILELSLERL